MKYDKDELKSALDIISRRTTIPDIGETFEDIEIAYSLVEEILKDQIKKCNKETDSMLTLSTAHITSQTAEFIDKGLIKESNIHCYPKNEYGWFLNINSVTIAQNLPEDLKNVINYAVNHGYSFICFDRDAEEIDDLETYEWDFYEKE